MPQYTCSHFSHGCLPMLVIVGVKGSQSQGQSSWLGLKGTGQSQRGPRPTFPVKSGKHGQSQGTGVDISSPTFEANPLVPTTPLDDTINTLSRRPWGLLKPRSNPQREDWFIAGEIWSTSPRPDSRWSWPGPPLWSARTILHCVASTKSTSSSGSHLDPPSSRLPFLAMVAHPPTAGIALETWFRHEPRSSRCNSCPPACHDRQPNIDGSNANAPSYVVLLPDSASLGGAGRNVASQH